ncbi:MAG: TfpX/TfpZ family type IV pilin accessory protein [Collimonas pratensis]|uniref:TfpX/TfpZ family type IV pilin accessory protein n=1 Tax=Collimonas pratensis TaxID=279113 RepID=UPI003C788C6F
MSRFRASGFHFLISFVAGLALLFLCWFIWYPAPMLMAIGGHQIFLLVMCIDVLLGPLLTLVVFKSGKKSLKFDLIVIALLQICAMAYGVNTLLEARPVYVAALGDQFQVIQATEVTDANLVKAKTTLPWWGPLWVGTKAPTDRYDVDAVHAIAVVGAGRGHLPQLHVPYDSMAAEILQRAQPIAVLKKHNTTQAIEIDAWLAKRGYDEQTAKFQPVKISASKFVVVIDARTAAIIGIAPFIP